MRMMFCLIGIILVGTWFAWSAPGEQDNDKFPQVRRTSAADGVEIVYTIAGDKEPALVFIHGGFADRSFWDNQVKFFAPTYQVEYDFVCSRCLCSACQGKDLQGGFNRKFPGRAGGIGSCATGAGKNPGHCRGGYLPGLQ